MLKRTSNFLIASVVPVYHGEKLGLKFLQVTELYPNIIMQNSFLNVFKPAMVSYVNHPSTWEAEEDCSEFKSRMGYRVRPNKQLNK